jgi:2'-hydroxyisoflavone reductase
MRRILILGGTAWLGRELARQLVDTGDHVTCLARGAAGPPPEGTDFIAADRDGTGAYDAVRGTAWDEVIEISWTRRALDAHLVVFRLRVPRRAGRR